MINVLGVDLVLMYQVDRIDVRIKTTSIGSIPCSATSYYGFSNEYILQKFQSEFEAIIKDKALVIQGLLQKQRDKLIKRIDEQLESLERLVK